MGLLDDPAMNFGIGLMAAGGPSRMPVSLGQGIAQGFQQAQQAEAQQQRRAMEEMRLKMFEQQMMQQKAAQEAEMRKRLALQSYLQNVPEQLRPLAGAFPEEVGKHMLGTMFAKPQGPIKLGAEETLIDPQTYQPIATGKGKKTPLEAMLDSAGITDPMQRQRFMMQALQKQTTHAPAASANVTFKQENEEAKTVGKGFGEAYVDLMKGDMTASGKIAKYDRMEQLLTGIKTGKLTPMGTEISALGKSIGIDLDPNLGTKQAAQAIANQLALELRNPSGGAGMPGALSDKDREFLVKSVPNLDKDPDANSKLIQYNKKLAQREKDVARLARDYRKKRGTLDEGFYDELAVFSERNPLFPSEQTASILDQADAILKGGK